MAGAGRLPQEPEWLDFNHLWTTGVPAHYLAILAGYLLALWLWRRNAPELRSTAETRLFVLHSLAVTVLIIVLDGIITQALLLRDFPGITFFVQHLLIGFVFVCAWTAYGGLGTARWIVGSLLLALVWTAYSMYLGPRGLPLRPPTYSGYDDLWWKSFPGALIAALAGWWLADRFVRDRWLAPVAATVLLCLLVPQNRAEAQMLPVAKGSNEMRATARASGDGMRIVGADPTNTKKRSR